MGVNKNIMTSDKNQKIYYYKSFNDDFIQSKNQNYQLKENYEWINNNISYKICSKILYCLAYIFGFFYNKFILHVKFENKKILKKYKNSGYFMYGNHTQPIGDIFNPALVCSPKRIYAIVSPANLGVACIGPLLPMLGALPVPNNVTGTKKLFSSIVKRIQQKNCVVIYPEGHVWEYYTKIRPFSSTSFKFPVYCNVPAFCMTTTYYKRKFSKKPGIIVYIDGPFIPDEALSKKENEEKIHKQIYDCMQNRSKNSRYEYIKYEKGE